MNAYGPEFGRDEMDAHLQPAPGEHTFSLLDLREDDIIVIRYASQETTHRVIRAKFSLPLSRIELTLEAL